MMAKPRQQWFSTSELRGYYENETGFKFRVSVSEVVGVHVGGKWVDGCLECVSVVHGLLAYIELFSCRI